MSLSDYSGLIGKLAYDFKSQWKFISFEYSDLFNEGVLIFYQCQESFDPKRGAFSTFLWKCIHSHFMEITRHERNKKIEFTGELIPDIASKPIMTKPSFFHLSNDTKFMLDAMLNGPIELVNKIGQCSHRKTVHYIHEIKEQMISY
jgi:hypothetical protein